MKTIGERIKSIRIKKNVSQKEVADFIGIHRPNYSKIENDRQNITPSQLKNLCEFFNVSADYILDIKVDNQKTISSFEYDFIQKALKEIKETLD